MVRPRARELTERELEIMHVFWESDALTATDVRQRLAKSGRKLAYTTVATLCANPLRKRIREAGHRGTPVRVSIDSHL